MKELKKYFKEPNYIHYSNCHEDFLMLKKYKTDEMTSVLSVASGLDNSLSFLTSSTTYVKAFDRNPSQIYLGYLKIEAIRRLEYEEVLILSGIHDGDRMAIYQRLREYLPEAAMQYFDAHSFLISLGWIHMGRFEYYFRLFRNKIFPLTASKKNIERFSSIEDIELQRRFYRSFIDTRRFRLMFQVFFSKRVMAKTGRDKAFFEYSKGSLSKLLKGRVDLGFFMIPNQQNPYYNYVLKNTYETMPYYLEKENFLKIKGNIDHITLHIASFDDMLHETYDFMNLSDIFEYMPEEAMKDYSIKIQEHLSSHGRVCFWNMMNERALSTLTRINSREDLKEDRAFFYRDYFVYEHD